MEHSHCNRCGKVITFWDWTAKIHEVELWKMCRRCRSNFIKEAVFMALNPRLPSTQRYFREDKDAK